MTHRDLVSRQIGKTGGLDRSPSTKPERNADRFRRQAWASDRVGVLARLQTSGADHMQVYERVGKYTARCWRIGEGLGDRSPWRSDSAVVPARCSR